MGRDIVTTYNTVPREGNGGRVRAVTCSVQAVPFQGNLWVVKVHNGTGGPITDLAVDVYAVDDAGNRVATPCTPAKGSVPVSQFMREVVGQHLQGALGGIADQAAAQSGFGFEPGISPAALGLMSGSSLPTAMTDMISSKIQSVVHAHMKDSFPAVLVAGNEETVLYGTGESLSVQADIRFADEDGAHWVRPFGQLPKPAQ